MGHFFGVWYPVSPDGVSSANRVPAWDLPAAITRMNIH
jgi:hypothetical protein